MESTLARGREGGRRGPRAGPEPGRGVGRQGAGLRWIVHKTNIAERCSATGHRAQSELCNGAPLVEHGATGHRPSCRRRSSTPSEPSELDPLSAVIKSISAARLARHWAASTRRSRDYRRAIDIDPTSPVAYRVTGDSECLCAESLRGRGADHGAKRVELGFGQSRSCR